jgi:hypothetical protein
VSKKTLNELQNVDKRLAERMASNGVYTADEMTEALSKLPDLLGECENIADRIYAPYAGDARE